MDPATGTPAQRVDPLVRSRGAELGVRLSPASRWRSTLSLWALGLNSELLFVGDGGATEPSFASCKPATKVEAIAERRRIGSVRPAGRKASSDCQEK